MRLIGAGVSAVAPEGAEILDLFSSPERAEKRRTLSETIDRLEDRYGRGKVTRARLVREAVAEPGTGDKAKAESTVEPRAGSMGESTAESRRS